MGATDSNQVVGSAPGKRSFAQPKQMAGLSAHYQFADGSNLQVPRKSAMTGRTAASDHCSERPLWAVREDGPAV
jgi:hypothetical protein